VFPGSAAAGRLGCDREDHDRGGVIREVTSYFRRSRSISMSARRGAQDGENFASPSGEEGNRGTVEIVAIGARDVDCSLSSRSSLYARCRRPRALASD
jgi:hypothetical protein